METLNAAWGLMTGFDPTLHAIIGLSLRVSRSAVFFALIVGARLGAALAIRATVSGGLAVIAAFNSLSLQTLNFR